MQIVHKKWEPFGSHFVLTCEQIKAAIKPS